MTAEPNAYRIKFHRIERDAAIVDLADANPGTILISRGDRAAWTIRNALRDIDRAWGRAAVGKAVA